ncbi:MAG: hypothetical protein RI538_03605 [Salibaculum sp.]|uniref:hypothetical protein n=1 Tax=Salibaculum sp. TaxID=2855480 RepID=UPI002870057B|nr:hypothetical protein [Salibaculum sp.]MDR9428141.1 hypothetical protein [Salibaculum sp.]MDR9481853.1 hypothetical protein [Salibaculum sp.]
MVDQDDDTDVMPLVAIGAALVAIGAALASARPLIGILILVGAVVLLVFAILRIVRRQTPRQAARGTGQSGAWLLATLAGMMLSGGGAALSVVLDPMTGLGIALGGGVLCGVGAWRMILGRG